MFKYLKIIYIQFTSETVSLFSEVIQLRSMAGSLNFYVRFFFNMKIGFKWQDHLVGQWLRAVVSYPDPSFIFQRQENELGESTFFFWVVRTMNCNGILLFVYENLKIF